MHFHYGVMHFGRVQPLRGQRPRMGSAVAVTPIGFCCCGEPEWVPLSRRPRTDSLDYGVTAVEPAVSKAPPEPCIYFFESVLVIAK